MEYDRRRAGWTVFFYLIYVVGVVYLLLNSNKFLYSHRELRSELAGARVNSITPVPSPAGQIKTQNGGPAEYWERGNPERTNHDSFGSPREKDFVLEWQKTISDTLTGPKIEKWAADESGIYLTGHEPTLFGLNLDGDVKWRFKFNSDVQKGSSFAPLIDKSVVIVARPEGDVFAIEKATGHLKWKVHAAQEIVSAPMLLGDELWIVVRPLDLGETNTEDSDNVKPTSRKAPVVTAFHRLVRLKRESGEFIGHSSPFVVKTAAEMSYSTELKQIFITSDNKLHAVSQEDGSVLWTQTIPDPIEGPAVIAEGRLFLSLTSGKIQAWDPTKKAKFEWEVDLSSPPLTAPTYVPLYQRLAVISSDQSLHMIDIKKAEHLWRFSLENRNPAHEIWAARMTGKQIEKVGMKWEKKGWSLWSPCSENRLCVYNPDKGQIVSRVALPDSLVSPALFVGKAFFVLLKQKGKDSSVYSLARFTDEETYKKKAKAAALESDASTK